MTAFISKLAKVGLAGHLQVQQDNHRTLEHQAAVRKALAQQRLRVNEAQTNQMVNGTQNGQAGTPADLEPDDMGNILIDSPTNNYYQTPPGAAPASTPAAPASPSLLSKATPYIAAAALAAGSGGLGAWLAKPAAPASQSPPVVTNTTSTSGFNLDLGDKK